MQNGGASLLAAMLGDVAVSFLYCGEYAKGRFGWSQANVEAYEREYSPRHFLECSTFLF